ncbi:hypothetical protein [Sphingomonas sp.]|jgi:hypothetical protein|uniref:hypothetical protein n=1 Tax=Sphingomonas sp. TaxID=28214 RepID=UPI002E327BBA|nr:hypothetical protein [Sphingomonas sp.]HEX4695286.1 hypothetical protein [Sphingomonas sp.]
MKSLPALCLAVLTAGVAAAPAGARWEYMTTRADGTLIAVEPATFARKGDHATAIFRFRKDDAEWLNLVGADCRHRGVYAVRLNENPATVTKAPRALPAAASYHPAVAGSVGAWLIGAMCRDTLLPPNIQMGPTGPGDPAAVPPGSLR